LVFHSFAQPPSRVCTKNKRWSPASPRANKEQTLESRGSGSRSEDADSCERVSVPKAHGMAKAPQSPAGSPWCGGSSVGWQSPASAKMNEPGTIYGRLRGHCHRGSHRAQGRELCMLASKGEQHSEVTTALALACVMPLWPAMRGSWSAGRHRPLTLLQRDLSKDIA
jgi:hypothetical protein